MDLGPEEREEEMVHEPLAINAQIFPLVSVGKLDAICILYEKLFGERRREREREKVTFATLANHQISPGIKIKDEICLTIPT